MGQHRSEKLKSCHFTARNAQPITEKNVKKAPLTLPHVPGQKVRELRLFRLKSRC